MPKRLILCAIYLGSAVFVCAQQTISNVPTADVLDRGKVYVELDAAFKPNDQSSVGRFSSFVPLIVVGVGGRVEVGLNLTGNIQPGADSTTIVPTIKWKLYENRSKDTAIIAGSNVYIPVRNRSYKIGTTSRGNARKLLRTGARIAGRLATDDWFAVYVRAPDEQVGRVGPAAHVSLQENILLAKTLGAKLVELEGSNVADTLLKFARENAITHVIFGQSARSRWQIIWRGSVINRFLREVKDAAVHVIPLEKD